MAEEESFHKLLSANALTASEVNRVTARDETIVVLLAGPVGSGKTTILISLYELFNQGPVAGQLFGGSDTLIGFEQICHPGRVASGLSIPETTRTSRTVGAEFLHLRVSDASGDVPNTTSLLVSDVTGEAFTEARDVTDPTIVSREMWRRADVICLLMNGENLASRTNRQAEKNEARLLLRAACESNFVTERCRLIVVTTKWDTVVTQEAQAFCEECDQSLRSQFSVKFKTVTSHQIAARPTSARVPYAYGVPRLMLDWITRPPSLPVIARPSSKSVGPGVLAKAFWTSEESVLEGRFDVI